MVASCWYKIGMQPITTPCASFRYEVTWVGPSTLPAGLPSVAVSLQKAVQLYLRGLHTSLFSDDTVRFRTHWIAEGMGKFAAARLADLKSSMTDQQKQDPYLAIFWKNDPESLRVRVRDYWVARAQTAADNGDPLEAYRCYYQAGWDLGLQFVSSYEEILDGLIRAAKDAGSPALAQIAELHQRFLPR